MSEVLKYIETRRAQNPIAEEVFLNGGCYRFFSELKAIFPDAVPYYEGSQEHVDHVVAKIGSKFYDIRGEVRGFFHKLEDKNLKVAKSFDFDFNHMTAKAVSRDDLLKD